MNPIYMRGHVQREDGDSGIPGDPITFVATTQGIKEDGLDLQMDRLDLDRFRANPVIGYGHRFGGRDNLPIGRASDITIDEAALMLSTTFDQDDDFALVVERKVRDGFINAMSVGFDAWNIDKDTGVPEGWALFEASVVPIPLDPDALAQVGRAAIRDLEGMLTEATDILGIEVVPLTPIPDEVDAVTALLEAPASTPRLTQAERRLRLIDRQPA